METNTSPQLNQFGIFDLDEKTYRALPGVNRTLIEILHNTSPEHAKYYLDNPSESTPAMELGIAAHLAALEPQKYAQQVVVVSSRSAKAKEQNPGKTLILEKEVEIVEGIKSALTKRNIYFNGEKMTPADLIAKAEVEKSVIFKDEVSGLTCKAKLDILFQDAILDFKTTTSIEQFKRDAYKFGIGRQAAFYTLAHSLATNTLARDYYLLVCEKEAPYGCQLFEMSDVFMQKGRAEIRTALTQLSYCMKHNDWPSYSEELQTLNLPPWIR